MAFLLGSGVTMDSHLLKVFKPEVVRQARFGAMAGKDLVENSSDPERVWYSIQSLLVAVGNVSKLLWPIKECDCTNRVELRSYFGVSNDSPLKSKKFRNHFEHFDERLEKWASSSKRKIIVDSNICPANAIVGAESGERLRNFDDQSLILTFRDEQHFLYPVLNALIELAEK